MFSNTLDSSAIASWMPGEAIPSLLVIAFLGAALSFLVLPRLGKSAGPVAALLPAGLFVAFMTYVPVMAYGEGVPTILQTVQWVPSLGINFDVRLDGFSLLFALMITGIGSLVVLYAGSYFAGKTRGRPGTLPKLHPPVHGGDARHRSVRQRDRDVRLLGNDEPLVLPSHRLQFHLD
jgi:hypothetical protein